MSIKVVAVDAAQLGVELKAFPSAQWGEPEQAQGVCNGTSRAIDHYISNYENTGVLT
jgi:hypothetical protein